MAWIIAAFLGNGCAEDARYQLQVHWDPPSLSTSTDRIEVAIVSTCEEQGHNGEDPVSPRQVYRIIRGHEPPVFSTFSLGTFGVYVRAYGDCRVRAAACVVFEAQKNGRGKIAVTLNPVADVPCVGECVDGFCSHGGEASCDADAVCDSACEGGSCADASSDNCEGRCVAQPGALCVGADPCTFACKPNYRDCNSDLSQNGNGCETLYQTLLTDPDHCGDCTRSCPVGPQRACIQGECVRHVFVSSLTHDGDFGLGAPEAFNLCQMLATDAGLGGTYYPWLWALDARSVYEPALSFPKSPVPYVRVDGVRIADDWWDLTDGTLDQPLNVDERGPPVIDAYVFTSIGPDGEGANANHCDLWRSNRMMLKAVRGFTSATDASWTQAESLGSCNELHRLYCFEQ